MIRAIRPVAVSLLLCASPVLGQTSAPSSAAHSAQAQAPEQTLAKEIASTSVQAPTPVADGPQDFTALARVLAERSTITLQGKQVAVTLGLSQSVPFRVYTLDQPARLVFDFQEVDFSSVTPGSLIDPAQNEILRYGVLRPGWSRLVLDLPAPQLVGKVAMTEDKDSGAAQLSVTMVPVSAAQFALRSGAPADPSWAIAVPQEAGSKPQKPQGGPVTVVLDPGHGGIDPGASSGGVSEATLMLTLAQELRDALLRAGNFDVVLTRERDVFVSLERRVAIARAAGADMFISLHADALASGKANGASVYTLSEEASDAASAALAERHNRTDLLAGVDLTGQDDEIAGILLDLARLENTPRSKALARGLILGINTSVGHTYKRPIQSAGFSVLKAADIPSVLVEVGFLSSRDDLSKLTDPDWRGKMVTGLQTGIQAWLKVDAANRALRRK